MHSFLGGNDGETPLGLTAHSGVLYGTTYMGGTQSYGTLFSINVATGDEAIIHSFTGGTDGSEPFGVAYRDGAVYGAATSGGVGMAGSLFKFSPRSGIFVTLHDFGVDDDGSGPSGAPFLVQHAMYGVTVAGGTYSDGLLYKINKKSGKPTILFDFNSQTPPGYEPEGPPIYQAGFLYGTTSCTCNGQNGTYFGAVFRTDPKSGAMTVLHAFVGNGDGVSPNPPLIYYHGALWGTSQGGGPFQATIFKIELTTGTFTTEYTFPAYSLPYAGLSRANGVFYGTTSLGGAGNSGTVYEYIP